MLVPHTLPPILKTARRNRYQTHPRFSAHDLFVCSQQNNLDAEPLVIDKSRPDNIHAYGIVDNALLDEHPEDECKHEADHGNSGGNDRPGS